MPGLLRSCARRCQKSGINTRRSPKKSSKPDVRSFPWRQLAPVTREEVALFQAFRRWGAAHVVLDRFAAGLKDLVGAEIELLVRRVGPLAHRTTWAEGVGAVFSSASGDAIGENVLVEAEAALAAEVVARVLRRPKSVPLTAADPRSPSLAGAFAAVLWSAARRAHQGQPLLVTAATSSASLAPALTRLGPDPCSVSLTVLLDHDAFAARVVLPRARALASPPPAWTRGTLSSLGPTPLALPVVALTVSTTAADVASLVPGDVFLVSPWELREKAGFFCGRVHLAAPSSLMGLRAELVEGGRLMLRGEAEPLGEMPEPETATGDAADVDALVENVGEIPVVVRVELGEATMTAREWAALGKGDVVTLGRRLGEPVVLRVGGVLVATGELVEVEGEVGVRIVARSATDTTRA
jgi:type III secretion system YscQ/HrcQ family protein